MVEDGFTERPGTRQNDMETTACYAYLNARIMPMQRVKAFEEPLAAAMAERRIGVVAGGGTLQDKNGEIVHCGIDIDLQLTPANVDLVCQLLDRCGAPKGSKLQLDLEGNVKEKPFGRIEGIGVYLNGTDLPDEVYRECDINVVMQKFGELTSGNCTMRGYWQGPTETALYLYGPSAAELQSQISLFVSEYPLCQRARVVRIA
jgi:hypothetical protein